MMSRDYFLRQYAYWIDRYRTLKGDPIHAENAEAAHAMAFRALGTWEGMGR